MPNINGTPGDDFLVGTNQTATGLIRLKSFLGSAEALVHRLLLN
jgi:hypothetical protein